MARYVGAAVAVAAVAMIFNAVANNHVDAGASARPTRSPPVSRAAICCWRSCRAAGIALAVLDGAATARPRPRRSTAPPRQRRRCTRSRPSRSRRHDQQKGEDMPCPMICATRSRGSWVARRTTSPSSSLSVGRRPQAVPAGGVPERGAVGGRRIRRRRPAGRARCRRPPTAAWPSTATPRRPRARRPCCCTATTTCSRRSARSTGRSPIFELTERDGRWYGRGAADCKGNIVMHLTALRALQQVDGGVPVRRQADLRGLGGAGHRRARGVRARATPTCCAPTRSSSSTPATSRSGSRR